MAWVPSGRPDAAGPSQGEVRVNRAFCGNSVRAVFERGLLQLPEFDVMAGPLLPDGCLVATQVIRRRGQRGCTGHVDEDNSPNALTGEAEGLCIEAERLRVQGTVADHGRGSLESIPLPEDRIDDVDLDSRVSEKVLNRPRRAHIGEDESVVVPDQRGPLR